jgi:hypothetical protein
MFRSWRFKTINRTFLSRSAQNLIIMDENLKGIAIKALSTYPKVKTKDVINIIEEIQQCYVSADPDKPASHEEQFLMAELQSFMDGLSANSYH